MSIGNHELIQHEESCDLCIERRAEMDKLENGKGFDKLKCDKYFKLANEIESCWNEQMISCVESQEE